MGGVDHSAVEASLLTLTLASICFAASGVSFLREAQELVPAADHKLNRIVQAPNKFIADSFFHNRRIMIVVSFSYALFFALINAIIVYQPGVDFGQAYGVSGTASANVLFCCGPPGYIPVGLVYFPSAHVGLELIPASIFLMVLISTLVALNVSLIYDASRLSRSSSVRSRSSSLSGALGAAIGLFAGCPTCAAAFFLSMLAGSGATVFSIYVSQYQVLIASLTVPILLASICSQARGLSIIMQGCRM